MEESEPPRGWAIAAAEATAAAARATAHGAAAESELVKQAWLGASVAWEATAVRCKKDENKLRRSELKKRLPITIYGEIDSPRSYSYLPLYRERRRKVAEKERVEKQTGKKKRRRKSESERMEGAQKKKAVSKQERNKKKREKQLRDRKKQRRKDKDARPGRTSRLSKREAEISSGKRGKSPRNKVKLKSDENLETQRFPFFTQGSLDAFTICAAMLTSGVTFAVLQFHNVPGSHFVGDGVVPFLADFNCCDHRYPFGQR